MWCALFLVLLRAGFADGILLIESQLLLRKFMLESHSVAGPMAKPVRRMLLFDGFPIDVFAPKLPQQQCGTFQWTLCEDFSIEIPEDEQVF